MGIHDYVTDFALELFRQELSIIDVFVHENYEKEGLWNDIGLIQTEKVDLISSDYVKPICLPRGEEPPEGTTCFVAGWGMTEIEMPRVLQIGSKIKENCLNYQKIDKIK